MAKINQKDTQRSTMRSTISANSYGFTRALISEILNYSLITFHVGFVSSK